MIRVFCFFIFLFLLFSFSKAQPGFTLTSTLCTKDTMVLTAQTGVFPATSFQWSSAPPGAVFSAPGSSISQVSFPLAGSYTITLGISAGSSTSYTAHTITILPLPIISLSSSPPSLCAGMDATLTASGASSFVWTPTVGLYFFSNTSAYISPNVTSSYTLAGTNNQGCVGYTSYTVDVNSYPALFLVPTSSNVCVGSTSTITANGASNYTWTGTAWTSPLYTPTVAAGAGNYSVVGANGVCRDSAVISIGLSPPLTISCSANRLFICRDGADSLSPVYLSASGASNFLWAPYAPGRMSFSVGPTTAVTPSANTCYTLTGFESNCSGKAVVCINIGTCASIYEFKEDIRFDVFPNPVLDRLIVHSNSSGSFTFRIRTATGEVLFEKALELNAADPQQISFENYPQGIYFISIQAHGKPYKALRVIKQ